MLVKIYNPETNSFENYNLKLTDTMPYIKNDYLTVGEFMGSSLSPFIYTDKRLLECFNELREKWGKPLYVPYAFKRIWEGGHGNQSQHYAGMAMDIGQNLNEQELEELRELARTIDCFNYVEPKSIAPTWVHIDSRVLPPACAAGYPMLKVGDENTYVILLQDALNQLNFDTNGLDGNFGSGTRDAVRNFQSSRGLAIDGVVGCGVWQLITKQVKGMGATDSTLLIP